MELTTTHCEAFQHPEFRLVISREALPKADRDWMLAYLESSVREGARFEPGETVQIGWMLNLVIKRADSYLGLAEPDMRSMPIEWIEDVSETLGQLRLQRDAAASLSVEGLLDFPSIRDSLVVGSDVTPEATSLVLERESGSGNDSGWFLGLRDSMSHYSQPTNLRRISLYEAAVTWPQIITYMALPPGFRIIIEPSHVSFFRDGSPVHPKKGSFLDQL